MFSKIVSGRQRTLCKELRENSSGCTQFHERCQKCQDNLLHGKQIFSDVFLQRVGHWFVHLEAVTFYCALSLFLEFTFSHRLLTVIINSNTVCPEDFNYLSLLSPHSVSITQLLTYCWRSKVVYSITEYLWTLLELPSSSRARGEAATDPAWCRSTEQKARRSQHS